MSDGIKRVVDPEAFREVASGLSFGQEASGCERVLDEISHEVVVVAAPADKPAVVRTLSEEDIANGQDDYNWSPGDSF